MTDDFEQFTTAKGVGMEGTRQKELHGRSLPRAMHREFQAIKIHSVIPR